MATGRQDNLADILVQLASTSAQLIDRARASGVFKPAPAEDIVPTQVTVSTGEPDPQTGALQTIIVQQAMKISALEAEVSELKAMLAAQPTPQPAAKPAKSRTK